MGETKKIFAEWYSLGAQEMAQGTIETRAMLVPGAGVLVQIEARTAGGRAALTAQWMPGVVIYEGRLVGQEWAERLMDVKTGARANMLPPLPKPPPLNLVNEGSTKPVHPVEPQSDSIKKLARKTRARKSDTPAQ